MRSLFLSFCLLIASGSQAQSLYWTDSNNSKIQMGSIDGSGSPSDLFESSDGLLVPINVALDAAGGKIYWTDSFSDKIQSGGIDGSGSPTDLFDNPTDGVAQPYGLALDAGGGKIYWTDTSTDKIQVGNIDGSGPPADLFDSSDGLDTPVSIALDIAGGKIYWSDATTSKIQVGNIDGSGSPTDLFDNPADGLESPEGIALDIAGGKIYWADSITEKIQVGNIDGSGTPTDLFDSSDGLAGPFIVALDIAGGKMYWSANDEIQVGNIDGSGSPADLFDSSDGLASPSGVALALNHRPDAVPDSAETDSGAVLTVSQSGVYYRDAGTGAIETAPRGGGSASTVVSGVGQSDGIHVDQRNGKIYWSDRDNGLIERADLDGSNREPLVSGLSSPRGLDRDPVTGQIWWVERGTGKISRANSDGTSVTDVGTGLSNPLGIHVDNPANRVYWTEQGTQSLMRMNLDGSNVQTVFSDPVLAGGAGVFFDPVSDYIYWGHWSSGSFYRIHRDGSDFTTVTDAAVNAVRGLAIDRHLGRIVYTTTVDGLLRESNLAGDTLATILSGTTSEGIALGDHEWNLLNNDIDEDVRDSLSVTAFDATSAMGATVTVNANGGFTYDPTGVAAFQALNDGEFLVDTFTYTLSDGLETDTASVSVTVNGADEPGSEGVIVSSLDPGFIEEGVELTLSAPAGSNWQWKVDGVNLAEDDPRLTGATSQTLVFAPVLETDSGTYTVVYDNGGGKAIVQSEPFVLTVLPADSIPVGGKRTLVALVIAMSATAAVVLRNARG